MNKEAISEIEGMYPDLLKGTHISLKRANIDSYPDLMLILGQINEYLPGTKIKFIDYKFGMFRISFLDDVIITESLKALKNVRFYC